MEASLASNLSVVRDDSELGFKDLTTLHRQQIGKFEHLGLTLVMLGINDSATTQEQFIGFNVLILDSTVNLTVWVETLAIGFNAGINDSTARKFNDLTVQGCTHCSEAVLEQTVAVKFNDSTVWL